MPELPEVETVRRDLNRLVAGKIVAQAHTGWERAVGPMPAADFVAALQGARIEGVTRRGKYLGLVLDTGLILVCHLKMTGRLLTAPPGAERPRWVHNWLDFGDGSHLWFQDVRKFGRLWLVDDMAQATGPLGPEPLDPTFTAEALGRLLAGRTAPIKALLLQQEVIAGIGNIYADEALWDAGLSPYRPGGSLDQCELERLRRALRRVLRRAIGHRGSSMDDYLDVSGQQGNYKPHLKAYGRKDLPCLRCGNPLRRSVLRQRSTVWCPTCQA